jgi:hypothetical protein
MLTGATHHFGRQAGIHAFRCGYIDERELRTTVGVHRRAGRMKHGISSRQTADVASELRERAAEEPDPLFYSDPWAGKSVERAAVSCETDVWQSWRHRHTEQTEADESCRHTEQTEADESCVGVRLIVDALVNEACRVLHLAVGDSIVGLPAVEMTTAAPTIEAELGDTAAEEEFESSDTFSGGAQDAEFDVLLHDRRIKTHCALLRRFWEEWGQVDGCIRLEAEQLSIGIMDGDDWWNDTLELAEQLEMFAGMFTGVRPGHMDGESVRARVREHLELIGVSGADMIVDEKIAMSGFARGCMAPSGAWVLLLALVHADSSDRSEDHCLESGVDAGDDREHGECAYASAGDCDDDVCSNASARLWHDGGPHHHLSDSESG